MDAWDASTFVRFHTAAFVGLLALTVAIQLLTGAIRTGGLLRDKRSGRLSPGRIQLLAVTLTGAGAYTMKVLAAPAAASLPEVPVELLAALGGSQAIYLVGKAGSALDLWSRSISRNR